MDKGAKILIIVEGAKTELRLMSRLLDVYGISDNHEIVSYKTNIYTLYKEMFIDNAPDEIDLLQLLKSRESNEEERQKLDASYTDILLIFDIEAHDPNFSAEEISEMAAYFRESSDMGKLYLNYPMVEAFYHMKSIPDPEYMERTVDIACMPRYKSMVNAENRNHDYSKFAVNKDECDAVIKQNIGKAWHLVGKTVNYSTVPDGADILRKQLAIIESCKKISVLCTCIFHIVEYNSKLIG